MKIKKGDKVIVTTGKDSGKTGTVTVAYPKENKVIVEGLNMVKRAVRSKVAKDKSQIISKEAKIHVSNVMVVDAKTGKGIRTKKAVK